MYCNPYQSRIADTNQVDRINPRYGDPMIRRRSVNSSVDSSVHSSVDSSVDSPNAQVITPTEPKVLTYRTDKRILSNIDVISKHRSDTDS